MSNFDEMRKRFADGFLSTREVEQVERVLGVNTLNELVSVGVVGEAFQAYYNHVNRDAERVRAGLHDGSARAWVISWHEARCRASFDNDFKTAAEGDDAAHAAATKARETAFTAFGRSFQVEATRFHTKYVAELAVNGPPPVN